MAKPSMLCAGIDTGKRQLDASLVGGSERLQVDNTPAGHLSLARWLRRHRVKGVGIEASVGCWGAAVGRLRCGEFVGELFQPAQLLACGRDGLQAAENDR